MDSKVKTKRRRKRTLPQNSLDGEDKVFIIPVMVTPFCQLKNEFPVNMGNFKLMDAQVTIILARLTNFLRKMR